MGVIVRVPLASDLLTGKMSAGTTFAADDHRAFNREGESFDKGETFAGVPYDLALEAVEQIRELAPRRRDDGAIRAALDPDGAKRQHGDPGRQECRAGDHEQPGLRAGRHFA